MSLPPGPRTPAAAQMAEWVLRPVPFIERCRARYGDFFTVKFVMGAGGLDLRPGRDQARLHR